MTEIVKKFAGGPLWCKIVGHRHQFEDLTTESEPALEITCGRARCEYREVLYGTDVSA